MKCFAFTLDLEPEYAGLGQDSEIFKKRDKIGRILNLLTSLGIKITVFVVGRIFELYPDLIELFKKYNCEFQVHGYSHKSLNIENREYEIQKGKKAYFDYFKKYPIGYRAACGRISTETIGLLEKHGFLYDSSIFPSYYPNPFLYLFLKRSIHYFPNSTIMEIPLTSITPFRLTLSLSYLKLLGLNFYRALMYCFKLPNIICFNVHLHDFIICEESYRKLPLFWKFIYGRNKLQGVDFCVEFLRHIKQKNYQFCFMSEIYNLYKKTKK